MENNLIDGKSVAAQIRQEVAEEVAKRKAQGRIPGLAVVLVGENPASKVYVNMKKKACEEVGMNGQIIRLPDTTSQQELLDKVREINNDPKWNGSLYQTP